MKFTIVTADLKGAEQIVDTVNNRICINENLSIEKQIKALTASLNCLYKGEPQEKEVQGNKKSLNKLLDEML